MRHLVLLALVAVTACGGETTSPTEAGFAGTFTLRSVNGSSLPYVLQQIAPVSVTIVSDAITLADGGTWTESGTVQIRENGQTTTEAVSDTGTWVRSGSSVTLHSTVYNSTSYSGTFTGTQLRLSDQILLSYVFSK